MPPIAVFDLDGTLVDTAPDLCASLNACLAAAGLPATTLDLVRPHAGHGARLMLQQAYGRAGHPLTDADLAAQLDRFLRYYEVHIADESRPLPGVLDAMERLRAAGFTLAVCTNKTERLARLLLRTLGMADAFAEICGADTFARCKPDPMHLIGTIERSNGRRENAVMIGDTATDTDAATASGIPSILIDFGYAPDRRARMEATVILSDYADLDEALCRRLIDARAY